MRVNDLAVGRDDIARPAGDLARRRAVDRYLLADIDIIARNDARPRAGDRELSRAFLRREFGERLDRIRRHADHRRPRGGEIVDPLGRSEEHTSELQSLMRISYAVFCLKKKNTNKKPKIQTLHKPHQL